MVPYYIFRSHEKLREKESSGTENTVTSNKSLPGIEVLTVF
jgi:hypothetical protein